MKQRPAKGHDDWDRWAVVGEPFNGPVEPAFHTTGTTTPLSDKPTRRRKTRLIGFRPPGAKR